MITLNYFDDEWSEDPYIREFDTIKNTADWAMDWGADKGFTDSEDNVWLFTSDCDNREVYVSGEWGMVVMLLHSGLICEDHIHEGKSTLCIQHYHSYEDAYNVALLMQEDKENCYSK